MWDDVWEEVLGSGRAIFFLGRFPLTFDAPLEEGLVWVSVPIGDPAEWVPSKTQRLFQLIKRFPRLHQHLQMRGGGVPTLRVLIPRAATKRHVARKMRDLLDLSFRWRTWLADLSMENLAG